MTWINLFPQGHEDRFSVYVHASSEKPAHVSRYFVGRDIHSEKVQVLATLLHIDKFVLVEFCGKDEA